MRFVPLYRAVVVSGVAAAGFRPEEEARAGVLHGERAVGVAAEHERGARVGLHVGRGVLVEPVAVLVAVVVGVCVPASGVHHLVGAFGEVLGGLYHVPRSLFGQGDAGEELVLRRFHGGGGRFYLRLRQRV